MKYLIAAYITAFQDKSSLCSCLEAIRRQTVPVDKIIVIDNSEECLLTQQECEAFDLDLKCFPSNIGISGGLNVGLQWSFDKNYNFLWTFDQDSIPEPDVLEKLLYQYNCLSQQNISVGILGPMPVDLITGNVWNGIVFDNYKFVEVLQTSSKQVYCECDAVITSGSLVNLEIARKIDLPRTDLFIDAVDWDYCMNFRREGFRVFVVKDAILKHRFGNVVKAQTPLKKRKISIYHYSPLRYYYMCRNHTYVETRLSSPVSNLIRCSTRRLHCLLVLIGKITFYEHDQKWLKTWACFRGTFDGFIGRLGKTWNN